ncbi:caspase domain-containing protein [Whalleya microplaca]|nr:caspase domain-containing protein [Whalleya microplaca]
MKTRGFHPQRFALLVGVDLYLKGGSRMSNGITPSVNNLRGCVNDVTAIQELLRTQFQLHNPYVLTSSPSAANSEIPKEPQTRWPTYYNIKRDIDKVFELASAGDTFLFYYAGHGSRLKTTSKSPSGRSRDPSLLPNDYYIGYPALRGWELNMWFKRLHEEKNVHVVVILDSCYSAGSWRNDGTLRTPQDTLTPSNLPIDETAIQEAFTGPNYRDGELDVSWDINPQRFTVMAACQKDQSASEKVVDDWTRGAFTFALLEHFNQWPVATSTYRDIRDQIENDITPQKPQVYGRDRLVFLTQQELFEISPVLVGVEGNVASFPIGRVHGVKKGAEFTPYPPMIGVVFRVKTVDDFQSQATVPQRLVGTLGRQIKVFPSKWGSDKTLEILVETNLPDAFRMDLRKGLMARVRGNIKAFKANEPERDHNRAVRFRVATQGDGSINIFGPDRVIGYKGPVRGLNIRGHNHSEQAIHSAQVISHLFRFEQILNLKNEASQCRAPFHVSLQRKPYEKNAYTFTFNSAHQAELYFTVLSLGPGYNIKQLYPPEDCPESVPGHNRCSFSFRLTIPNELLQYDKGLKCVHRDIIRTIVTKEKKLSYKSLELPAIWNANQVGDYDTVDDPDRDADLISEFAWWIHDKELFSSSS